jgi:hypothetical protein
MSKNRFSARRKIKSQVWRVQAKADDRRDPELSVAPINMVFMLPREFMARTDSDENPESEEAIAQFALEPISATFEKPKDKKCQHLKALFLKGFVNGKPIT